MSEPRIVIALDFDTEYEVIALVDQLDPALCRLKVGKQLFVRCGPSLLEKLALRGFDVFLDLKFHDIPNTVAEACLAAADWGVWMVNVHAQGGRRMMNAAAEALQRRGDAPLLIGVTVLTSMDQSDLIDLGIQRQPADWARSLAGLARESGLDGVVCSAQEAPMMKAHCGQSFQLVTPGIRPAGSAAGDQRRIVTPAQAVANGADYLVVGRPITQSPDPIQALQSISVEVTG